jgi:hypothetical protein
VKEHIRIVERGDVMDAILRLLEGKNKALRILKWNGGSIVEHIGNEPDFLTGQFYLKPTPYTKLYLEHRPNLRSGVSGSKPAGICDEHGSGRSQLVDPLQKEGAR